MRPTLAIVVLASSAASAAPPVLSPTGELEPRAICAQYMDFTHAVRGSAPDGLADSVMTTTYDASGRAIAERWWRMDAPVRIVEHSYDSGGRKIKTTWRLADQKLVLTFHYRYDRNGNRVAEISRYANGKSFKSTRRFDKYGRLIESREVGESGTMMSRRYRYKNGRISLELFDRTGNGKIDERTTYSYDAEGRLRSKLMKPRGDYADQLIEYNYDRKGQLLERVNTHLWPTRPKWNGPREILSYRYDADGNLIATERRITRKTGVGVRWVYDYSCRAGSATKRSLPAASCRASFPKCGSPTP